MHAFVSVIGLYDLDGVMGFAAQPARATLCVSVIRVSVIRDWGLQGLCADVHLHTYL